MNNEKDILLAKRSELREKIAVRDGMVIERNPDALDDVQQSAEREFVISTLDREWQTLKDIDAALARIEEDTYGICVRCEEEISAKRLKAIPWAALCISCQELKDRHTRRHLAEDRFDMAFSDAA